MQIRGDYKEFCNALEEMYPHISYQVVEDDNDSEACLIYVDDVTLVEDEFEYGRIEELAFECLEYEDVKIVHEFPENLSID